MGCLCFGNRRKRSRAQYPYPGLEAQPVQPYYSNAFQSPPNRIEPFPTTRSAVPTQITRPNPLAQIPTFPRPNAPQCRRCGWIPRRWETVKSDNQNGNIGRRYYICIKCKNDPNVPGTRSEKGWLSWDDNIGIHQDNRPCFCGYVCRQDRAGPDSFYPGGGFWTCATGTCSFLSWRKDGLTNDEALNRGLSPYDGFEPWQLRAWEY